jgi:signal transduction histidine kinase
LRDWHQRYDTAGLTIVGVHTPEFLWERFYGKVAEATRRLRVSYPVVQDNDHAIWKRFGIRAWPTAVLIDKTGVVRYWQGRVRRDRVDDTAPPGRGVMASRFASPQARFSAFALLAIVLPAAVLAVLGHVSLRQWETTSELLFREQSREMASMAAEKVRMVLAQVEDEAIRHIQAAVQRAELTPEALETARAAAPLIQRLYLFDRGGRLLFPPSWSAEDADVLATLPAEIPPGLWASGGRRYVRVGREVLVAVVLRAASGAPLLVGLSRDPEVLRRDVFAKTLGSVEGPSVVAILDADERPVYARETLERADRIVSVALGDALPAWRVALYQTAGVSPREAVRRQIALFTGAFGLLLVVIVAGLGATYRLVRRETQMARLKADFVANVSHDLKTPLSLIRMFGETLEMGRLRDEQQRQEYYRVITRESERLSRLIDNVLDFSRIDGGRRRYDFAPAAVEPLVRETVDAFGYVLAQQGFTVEIHVAPDLPDLTLDAEAISQALANLIDNAIKYAGERKSLVIDASLQDEHLALSVADQGIGIPPEEQSRIFEMFYRVGRSETQGRRGSGMGLALVRHIMDAHGGRVTVESRPGHGSRFTLWLPCGPSAARAEGD